MNHLENRGWEQQHQPEWVKSAIEARMVKEGSQGKRCPPSGFFPMTSSPSSAAERQESYEDATAMVSPHYSGLRWIEGDNRRAGWNTKFETLTVMSHFDQIWSDTKNTKDEVHRSFHICRAASDLPTHDTVRLILSEMQDRGISVARITHIHPLNPPPGQEPGPTTIVVVLQSFGVREAALLFHLNERFLKYSWHNQGLFCREPRASYQKASKQMVPPDWTMGHIWNSKLGADQLEERETIRRSCGVHQSNQPWGRLLTIPLDTELYELSHF